jgi:hypothetical protein
MIGSSPFLWNGEDPSPPNGGLGVALVPKEVVVGGGFGHPLGLMGEV